jgi:hypothetical protein
MGAIASLLVVVATSVLITRIATSALVMTGVSRELANFKARSAYTGIGLTTNEAETVVAHGVRRKIILTLMLLGSAGVAGAIASLVAGFAQAGSSRPRNSQRFLNRHLAQFRLLRAQPIATLLLLGLAILAASGPAMASKST